MPPRIPTKSDFPTNISLDIIPPPSGGSPINILILLHGLGDTQTSFTTLAKNLNLPETACISLRGFNPIPSIFTGSEDPAFHWGNDVLFDESKGEIEADAGFSSTVAILGRDVVSNLIEKCGYAPRNIVFYGYGQGGMLALGLASQMRDKEFGGIISIGGKLPSEFSSTQGAKSRTPVVVCGGSRSTQVTRSAVDGLKGAFVEVEYVRWEKYEDSMPRSRDEMLPIMKFFARRLQSRKGVPEGAVEI